MEKLRMVMVVVLALSTALFAENGDPGSDPVPAMPQIAVTNDLTTTQNQSVSASGGSSQSDSFSNASVNLSTTSVSNYETRTAPLTSLPPYLPYWTHGGWGTVKAYFPNGPTINDQIYETTFDPENPDDMRELRSVLRSLPHDGLLEAVGGVLNSIAVVLFGSPDRYHHGRGLEIVNSVTRDRRPEGKPLLVFIDSNVDVSLLAEEGYVYMGKVGIEGDVSRNWDQAYKTAVTEALLWDVDILLVSGGMKGVTVGSNVTFPSAAAGYSQVNYSLSLMGAKATGITEGKGKAVLSADAYRFLPDTALRRKIPESLYDRIRARPQPVRQEFGRTPMGAPTPAVTLPEQTDSVMGHAKQDRSLIPQPEPQGAAQDGQLLPRLRPQQDDADGRGSPPMPLPLEPQSHGEPSAAPSDVPQPPVETEHEPSSLEPMSMHAVGPEATDTTHRDVPQPRSSITSVRSHKPGICVSRELFAMSGFRDPAGIGYVTIR